MKVLNVLFLLTSESGSEATSEFADGGTSAKLSAFFKAMIKSPIFYIVIVAIVLLLIAFYLLKRFVKPSSNEIKVVTRGGKIYKLIGEKDQKCFLVPFKDKMAASVYLGERTFESDQLFINNGPDALYKINYSIAYKVNNVELFFANQGEFQDKLAMNINDALREYADEGHALEIVKDYRNNSSMIVELINKITNKYGVETTSLKINYIEPLGKK